ncbi:hypothetical protein Dimus_030042 [Dionaea muscipula]
MNNQIKENQQEIDIIIIKSYQTDYTQTTINQYAQTRETKVNGWIIPIAGSIHGRDTPSSNSRTKPSRTTSNYERHHQDQRKEKHDSRIQQDPYQGRQYRQQSQRKRTL